MISKKKTEHLHHMWNLVSICTFLVYRQETLPNQGSFCTSSREATSQSGTGFSYINLKRSYRKSKGSQNSWWMKP